MFPAGAIGHQTRHPKNTPSTPAQASPHGDLLILKAQLVSFVQIYMRPRTRTQCTNLPKSAQSAS